MHLELELLPPEVVRRPALASALRSGVLAPEGLLIARASTDIAPPRELLEPRARAQLAQALEAQLARHAPHVRVLDAVRALAQPGVAVVVTGQQPGLLVSPLLTIYKALHALRLARTLEQAWERPVTAVFWNHADDHDVAEVHHAWIQNQNLDLQKVGLAGVASGRQPLARIRLDNERHRLPAIRQVLLQALQAERGAAEAVELLAPRAGETLASAFTRALTALLGHLGLVVIEPDWIREELSRALVRVLDRDPRPALRAGADLIRAAGHVPSIDPDEAALVYRVDAEGRHALRPGGDGFRYDHEPGSRTPAELAAQIVADPHAWSPGALLRPLVQDLSLPVAAYIGGPGELAYHAQLAPLRRAVGAPATPFVERWSCTLLEDEVARSLETLGKSVAEAFHWDANALEAGEAEPAPEVVRELRAVAQRASEELQACKPRLAELDRGLAQNLGRTAAQVRGLVDKLCEKAERVHANHQGKGRRHFRRVANALAPRGELQERVLGPLPFLARHGGAWIDALFEALPAFEERHVVARLPAVTRAGEEQA